MTAHGKRPLRGGGVAQPLPASSRLRRRLAAVLTLGIVAAVVVIGYRRRGEEAPAPATPGPVLGPDPLTLAPGIHYLGSLSPAVAYAVETSDGLVLIDSGLDRDAQRLKRDLAALGLDVGRLRAILLTHAHGDHSGGAEYLRALTGARVYAGRGDAAVLRAGGPREAFFSIFEMPSSIQPAATKVDVELSGGEVIPLGDTRFEAMAAPGHSPGSICYLMQRGEQRVLFSGDVILSLLADVQADYPSVRPLGTYAAYLAPRYRGDARDFLASLRRLRAMPAPQLLLPGHPHNDPEPQSPAISQEDWEALLDPGIAEMETLLAHRRRDGASFLDGDPKPLLPGLYYLGDFKGVAVYGLLAGEKLTVVNAPGGPGLLAFVQAGLKRLGAAPLRPDAVLLTSGHREETAGLSELTAGGARRVVAAAELLPAVKKDCSPGTELVSADQLPGKDWLPVKDLSLEGRGKGEVAYLLSWAGKGVLLTGRIPVKLNRAAYLELLWDVQKAPENARAYIGSLGRLAALKPDLWLPAFPTEGQNANLYGNEWRKVLAENRQMFR